MRQFVLAGITAFTLCGCSTLYPPLYSPASVTSPTFKTDRATLEASPAFKKCKADTDKLTQTLNCAEVLQAIYSNNYRDSATWSDIAHLPIIGAAGAAAWVLLNDKKNATTKAGKILIGGGVLEAGRNQLLPADLPTYYVRGHSALGCVISEGQYFSGGNAQDVARSLRQQIADTRELMVAVQTLRYFEPPKKPAYSADLLTAARSIADTAVTQASAQVESSESQLGQHDFAEGHFRRAVTDIAAWVATKGRTRPNLTLEQAVEKFKPKEKATSTDPASKADDGLVSRLTKAERDIIVASTDESLSGGMVIAALARGSRLLANSTSMLKGRTPDYAGRLAVVTRCVPDAPAS